MTRREAVVPVPAVPARARHPGSANRSVDDLRDRARRRWVVVAPHSRLRNLRTPASGPGRPLPTGIPAVRPPTSAAGRQKFKPPASRFSLAGVVVGKGPQDLRVAVTAAGACAFRSQGLEAKLAAPWPAAAPNGATVSADGPNNDLHGSAAYRAARIPVPAARSVG